jgi:hypothetical protein
VAARSHEGSNQDTDLSTRRHTSFTPPRSQLVMPQRLPRRTS